MIAFPRSSGPNNINASADSDSTVAQAATSSNSAPGYRLRFNLQVTTPALARPVTTAGTGTFDLRNRVGALSSDTNLGNTPQVVKALGGRVLHMDELINHLLLYMKFPPGASGTHPRW